MTMFNVFRKEIEWGGRPLIIETGKMGRQADASVIVRYGETSVHCAVCAAKKEPDAFTDFFPLTVNYIEKTYAAGKIPGGFMKREGRPSEKETLVSRLIDRPIRPLFAKGFKNETQVVCTLLSHDLKNESDIVAMIATSAALTLSGLPFLGPIGAARVGYIDGQYVLNPTLDVMDKSQLDLVVAGTTEGVLMVESEANELSEDVMLGSVAFGHKAFQSVIQAIISLAEECAKEPWKMTSEPEIYQVVRDRIQTELGDEIATAFHIREKLERQNKLEELKEKAVALFEENEEALACVDKMFHEAEYHTMRDAVLSTGVRIDGRDTKTVRPIECEVGVLPKVHGSALFTRGETQALVVSTLGTGDDEQIIDAIEGNYRRKFMLHYNFPAYSVGEVKRMGSPGRREIGHGKLAWRAVHPMLPSFEQFPYTIRVVSEIMESNGSSSMATVCGATLSMMDAGIPMKKPVAGIAMGLIKEDDRYSILTDIMGDEDHLGDMDFKVAGTKDGITALQMDIKITSITEGIMKEALAQAHEGRLFILGKMTEVLAEPRAEVSPNAPRIFSMTIKKDKIRDVIGTGGKVIREITEKTGCKLDIDDDGTLRIAAVDGDCMQKAIDWVKSIVDDPEPGHIYTGKVVKIMDFGAFVNFCGAQDGLVHISELAPHRVEKVTDFVKEGDEVKVKFMGSDNRGKMKLSMKRVDQTTGEDLEAGQETVEA
ncbi:MAG: polyribonucleotide nucleotidyltransferase [Alphaproteobacteria bacterium]|nr:polyribonucleotide nucleotidyltransferase [Alphaproteobacteria bacterium]